MKNKGMWRGRLEDKEIIKILNNHKEWLLDKSRGHRAEFYGNNLMEFDFSTMDLSEAVFFDSRLIGCNFSNANLTNAEFVRCDLRYATFDSGVGVNTNFCGSNLDFTGNCPERRMAYAFKERMEKERSKYEEMKK